MSNFFNKSLLLPLSIVLGLVAGYLNTPILNASADTISSIFINLLKLVSLPIIFLSIISTASGMESMHELKNLGSRVVKYTVLTTLIAATIALALFLIVDPVRSYIVTNAIDIQGNQASYFTYLMKIIPSNFLEPFIENNVISVLFLAMVLSLAILTLPDENRVVLHTFFKSFYRAIMSITGWIVMLMPIAIWAFITLFIRDLRAGLEMQNLIWYLFIVVAANLIQAIVVLPLLLRSKGISPIQTFKAMIPALSVAFFTKSSSAALPMAVKCAEDNAGVSPKIAGFSLPLCTTINMNACAAFILTTVLFVSMSNGMTFSLPEMLIWIVVATIAAIGNAGVPMGCYFIASAFLASMNVPLNILGVILPFYTLIDMLESAINVWSDSCVTVIVQKEVNQEADAEVDLTLAEESQPIAP